ncbi:phage protease [Paracoccus sanguinis]|uniref:phage protease n=1 Tax=Paracoccus sanguinis TaxID=1545044 RepID=UPI00051FA028|nr:phage protease [Paracoccus sanguinis]KGJ20712.1 hypothetical protein IX55_05135 [Paracoccus sanguinis]
MTTVAANPTPLPQIEGAVSRVQLLPLGTLTPGDRRGPWHVVDPAAIIAASMPKVARGMPVDLDHAIDRKQNAPAAGWIKTLTHDQDGIWAEIEWTPMGKARIEGREYRFISPTLIIAQSGNVLRIDRAGLTNDPALEMAALCAKEDDMPENGDTDAALVTEVLQFLSALRQLLGLPEGASTASMLSAVRQAVAPRKAQDAAPVVEQLASAMFDGWTQRRQQEAKTKVSTAIRSGRLPPALEGWGMKVCAANGGLFDEFIRDAPDLSYLSDATAARRQWQGDKREADPNSVFAQLGIPVR